MSPPAVVTLDLQEGFLQDEVSLSSNGQQLAWVRNVTTRTQLGLAQSLQLSGLPAGTVRLTVALPRLGLTESIDLPETRPLWVAASLNDARDRLSLKISAERLGYV